MKSSRSVSCSTPLKGDAMAAVLRLGAGRRRRQAARNCGTVPPRCRKATRLAHAHPRPPGPRAPCRRGPCREGACHLPGLLSAGGGAARTTVSPPSEGPPGPQCRLPHPGLTAGGICGPESLPWELAEAAALLYLVAEALETPEGRLAPPPGVQFLLQSERNGSDRAGSAPHNSAAPCGASLTGSDTLFCHFGDQLGKAPFPCKVW